MKFTKLFYLLLFTFSLFVSCDDSEDDAPAKETELLAELQGLWLYEGLSLDGNFEANPTSEVHYDFKSGGILDVIYDEGTESGTYQVNGDNLNIRLEGVTQTYSILELTNNEMQLFTEAEVDEEPGLDEVTFHFSRE